jgi:hypothetical protein
MSQLSPNGQFPGYDGSEYCGPTDLAMNARAQGLGGNLVDALLIQQLANAAGTDANGSTPAGLVAGAQSMGMVSATAQGLPDFNWVQQYLSSGWSVILRGDYFALPPHQDPSQYSGHYILIAGWSADLGEYLVNDPADLSARWELAADLTAFVQAHQDFSATDTYEIAVGGQTGSSQ